MPGQDESYDVADNLVETVEDSSALSDTSNIDMFALDEESDFDSLDQCIDASRKGELFSIAKLIKGRNQQQKKRQKTQNLKPVTFVRFNTRRGKAKPVTVTALLDSGGGESIVTEKIAKNLKVRTTTGKPKVWSTPAGDISTRKRAKSQFTMPELHDDRLVEWDFHVTKSLGAYDVIIGRDLLEFLGIDIRFSDRTIEWDAASVPFKDTDNLSLDCFHMEDPPVVHRRLAKRPDDGQTAGDGQTWETDRRSYGGRTGDAHDVYQGISQDGTQGRRRLIECGTRAHAGLWCSVERLR